MKNNLLTIFRSIKGSYNLIDFAQKSKGEPLPRSRASIKKEYEILKQYKEDLIIKNEAIEKLTYANNIDYKQAKEILEKIDSDNIVSMEIK